MSLGNIHYIYDAQNSFRYIYRCISVGDSSVWIERLGDRKVKHFSFEDLKQVFKPINSNALIKRLNQIENSEQTKVWPKVYDIAFEKTSSGILTTLYETNIHQNELQRTRITNLRSV